MWWTILTSRIGLLTAAFVAVFVFYEGIPIGPLARVPGVGPILQELTAGRVDRAAIEARKGYVLEVRAIAAEERLKETERQLEAGRKSLDMYAELLKESQERERVAIEEQERKITDYEKELATAGRSCGLDQRDIDWLLNDR